MYPDSIIYLQPVTICEGLFRAGGTQRLPRLVGKSTAKELIFTGRKIGGSDALSMGMSSWSKV